MALTQKRLKRWVIKLYQWLENNTIKTLAGTSLLIGGGILFTYVLSIGELPEFTLTDLTGTLIAIFAIGLLIFIAFGIYCLLPGIAARSVLDKFYPEAKEPSPDIDANQTAIPTPRAWLLRSRFLPYVTLVALQTLLTLGFWLWSDEQFAPPHDTEFTYALWAAWITITLLLLIDWRLLSSKKGRFTHHTLLAIWAGSLLMIAILFTAASADPDRLWLPLPVPEPQTPLISELNWTTITTAALPYIWWVGASVALLTIALLLIAEGSKHLVAYLSENRYPWLSRLTRYTTKIGGWLKHIVAKLCITAAFTLSLFISLLVSVMLIDIGSTSTWLLNLILLLCLQISLNWVAFSLRTLVARMLLVLCAAATFLVFFPVVLKNPSYFSKTIIATLGLGNIHLQSISLAGGQCATLALYGVPCSHDANSNLTLTNVNLMSRVGASPVLELMIQPQLPPSASPPPEHADLSFASHDTFTTLHMFVPDVSQAIKKNDCDAALLEQSSNSQTPKPLLCIQLVIPKEQIMGYVKGGRRHYGAGYSAFINTIKPGPLPDTPPSEL